MKESELKYTGLKGIPIDWIPGNSVEKNTGLWRTKKPVIDAESCSRCKICYIYCPDSAIDWVGHPEINYYLCKGCGIGAAECPKGAIKMIKE